MQIRSFLKKVEARAGLRDLLRATLLAATFATCAFLSYAAVDRLFSLPLKARLIITACLALATLSALALAWTRKHRKRGLVWAASHVEQRTGTLNNQLITIAEHETSG